MEIINIMYLIDYELKFKSWQSYVELPFGLSFLMDGDRPARTGQDRAQRKRSG